MAIREVYIGSVGPYLVDDEDPLFSDPGQVAFREDVIYKKTPIVAATKTKITYDSSGLVVSGADITVSDISNLSKGSSTLVSGYETVITDINATEAAIIILQGTCASFLSLSPYVSLKSSGSFTITTSVAAVGTETFDYVILP